MSNVYQALERLFHEPNRLAVMSELCAAKDGVSFGELRDACHLTDGNLSRHLAALEKEGVIKIEKSFVGAKPRTTVFLSGQGRKRFLEYLDALEQVLKQAAKRAKPAREAKGISLALTKPSRS